MYSSCVSLFDGLPKLPSACWTTTTTTTWGKGLTRRVEGGRAAVMSYPLPLLSHPHLWNQVRYRGWALLQGGELTEGGTCPCPLPLMWQPSLKRRRILLFLSHSFLCLDVKIRSNALEDFLMSPSLLLVVLPPLGSKLSGWHWGICLNLYLLGVTSS